MFFNKNSLFLLLCALFCSQINSMEQRDLIMIIDDKMGLGTQDERQNVDWTLLLLMENLTTKTAPMIVSSYTWRNFVVSRSNFNQKKDIPDSVENNIYTQIYQPITKEINNIAKQSGYDAATIADTVNVNEKWQSACLETIIGKIFKPALNKSILDKEFGCFSIPFNPAEWDVYTYKHALYILIPHDYGNRIHNKYTKKSLEQFTFKDHKTGKILDKKTALLGIKTNNLTKITISDIYELPYEEPQIKLSPDKGLPMDEILITNKDVITSRKTRIVHPFLWNVYIMGHGLYYVPSGIQENLDTWLNDIQKNKRDIERLTGISFKYTNHDSLIAKLNLHIKEKRKQITELHAKNIIDKATEIDKSKKQFEQALKHAKDLQYDYEWAYNRIFNDPNITIAGIPALAFTKLLHFFNNEVSTSFLFYDTCFAGARNLLFPYITAFGEPMEYNYTIATGTVTDKITITTDTMLLNQACIIPPGNIYIEKNKVSLIADRLKNFSFKEFFEALHTNKPLAQTLKYVHEETPLSKGVEVAEYKPVIRLPGSTGFYIHDIDAKIQKISRVILSVANMQGKLTIDGEKKPGVVLNTYFIPVPINFVNTLPVSIVSSIYEPTLQGPLTGAITGFYFKEIVIPNVSVNDIADLLVQGAIAKELTETRAQGDNPIPKLFLCDVISRGSEQFEKVLIFNNIALPNSLTKKESSDDFDISATGMIYTIDGETTINAWITTMDLRNGERSTEEIYRELETDEEKDAYNNLYDDAKNELTQKANSEGLTIIPLEAVAKTLQSRAAQTTPQKK